MDLLLPLLLVAFLGIMFLASRRQKKEAQAVAAMQDALTAGDEVMTTSGLHGTVTDVDEDTIDIEIAPGVVTTWNRLAVRAVVADDTTEDDSDEDDTDEDDAAVEDLTPATPRLRKD